MVEEVALENLDESFERLLAAAAASEASNNTPRKHHLVPRSYLKRWEENSKLRATEINGGSSFLTSAAKAARETDFYRLESADPVELPPMLFETILSNVEGAAVPAIDRLIQHVGLFDELQIKLEISDFLTMQLIRGRHYRGDVQEMRAKTWALYFKELGAEGIEKLLEKRYGPGLVPDSEIEKAHRLIEASAKGEFQVRQHKTEVMRTGLIAAQEFMGLLFWRNWVVVATPNCLVTCDEPLVLIGGPGMSRGRLPGIAEAAVIIFPLCPNMLLAMVRHDLPYEYFHHPLSSIDIIDINTEILANAYKWGFERPSKMMTQRLHIPAKPLETVVFEEAPYPDAQSGRKLITSTHRTSWASIPGAPWPVERWWRWSEGGVVDSARARQATFEAAAKGREFSKWLAETALDNTDA